MSTPAAGATWRLDPASRPWLSELRREGPLREAAIARLHALLLGEARHEARRRTAGLAHPSGRDLDDLAVQAADDALVAVHAKLEQVRGDALFTIWARRFAALQVPGGIRRRRVTHERSRSIRRTGHLSERRAMTPSNVRCAPQAARRARSAPGRPSQLCARPTITTREAGGVNPTQEVLRTMTVDTLIDAGSSLGELVAECPARAQLFERLRLDYCCGGRQTLAEACAKRGLALNEVRAALEALGEGDLKRIGVESRDWRAAGMGELCAHIVTVHHDGLREAFPRLERLFGTVVRVHGSSDPRLGDAQRLFDEIRSDLEPHLASEEAELFPACVASEQAGTPVDEQLLSEHEAEHAELGHALAALRVLCDDYDRRAALCNTHRALLDALEAFEQDLHRHVHEENNILLPRARKVRPAPAAERSPASRQRPGTDAPKEALPPCCEGWIAEQTHSWAARNRRP